MEALGLLDAPQAVQPRSRREAPAQGVPDEPRVASDSSTCPPWAASAIRAARCTSGTGVVVPAQDALAGVEAHRTRTGGRGTVVGGELPLGGDDRPDGPGRAAEREEGVAVGADLDPAACGDGPDDRRVPVEDRRVPVAERLEEAGRALDVGEQERHGPGRQVGHPLTLCCLCRSGTRHPRRTKVLLADKNAVVYGGRRVGRPGRGPRLRRRGARSLPRRPHPGHPRRGGPELAAGGGSVETAQVDALDERAVDEHADAVAEQAGGIDVSFNAIGHGDVHGAPLLVRTRTSPGRS